MAVALEIDVLRAAHWKWSSAWIGPAQVLVPGVAGLPVPIGAEFAGDLRLHEVVFEIDADSVSVGEQIVVLMLPALVAKRRLGIAETIAAFQHAVGLFEIGKVEFVSKAWNVRRLAGGRWSAPGLDIRHGQIPGIAPDKGPRQPPVLTGQIERECAGV